MRGRAPECPVWRSGGGSVRRWPPFHRVLALFVVVGGLIAVPVRSRAEQASGAVPPAISDSGGAGRGSPQRPAVVNVAFAWLGPGPDAVTGSPDSPALFVYRGRDGFLEVELCRPFITEEGAGGHPLHGCASLVAWIRGNRAGDQRVLNQGALNEFRERLRHVEAAEPRDASSRAEAAAPGGTAAETPPGPGSAGHRNPTQPEAVGYDRPHFRFRRMPPGQTQLQPEDLDAEGLSPYQVGVELRRLAQDLSSEVVPDVEELWSLRPGQPPSNGSLSIHLLGHLLLFERGGGGGLSATERTDATILQLVRLLGPETPDPLPGPINLDVSGLRRVCPDIAEVVNAPASLSLLSTEGRQARNALTIRILDRLDKEPAYPPRLPGLIENPSLKPAAVSLSLSPDFAPVRKGSQSLTLEPCSSWMLEPEQEHDKLNIRLRVSPAGDAASREPLRLLIGLTEGDFEKPVRAAFRAIDDEATVKIRLEPSPGGLERLLGRLPSWVRSHRQLSPVLVAIVAVLSGSLAWLAGTRDRRRRKAKARSHNVLALRRKRGEPDVLDPRGLLQAVRTGPLREVVKADEPLWEILEGYPDLGTLSPTEQERVQCELQRVVDKETLADTDASTAGTRPASVGGRPADQATANANELRSAYSDIVMRREAGRDEFLFSDVDWTPDTLCAIVRSFEIPDSPGLVVRRRFSDREAKKLSRYDRSGPGWKKHRLRAAQRAASEGFNRALGSPRLMRDLRGLSAGLDVDVPAGLTDLTALDLTALNRHLLEVTFRDWRVTHLKPCPRAAARVEELRWEAGSEARLRRLSAKQLRRLLLRIRMGTDPMSVRLRAVIEQGPNHDILNLPRPTTPDGECVRRVVDRLNAFILGETAWPRLTDELALRQTTRNLLLVLDDLAAGARIKLGRYLVEDLCRDAIRSLRTQEEVPTLPESESPEVGGGGRLEMHPRQPMVRGWVEPQASGVGVPKVGDQRLERLRLEVRRLELDLDSALQGRHAADQDLCQAREELHAAISRTTLLEDENRTLTGTVTHLKEDLAASKELVVDRERTASSMAAAFGIPGTALAGDPVDAVRTRIAHLTELALGNLDRLGRLLGRAGLERAPDPGRRQLEDVLADGLKRINELECLEEVRTVAPELFQLPGLLAGITNELKALAEQPEGCQALLGETRALPADVAERFAAAVAAIGEDWCRALDALLAAEEWKGEELARQLRRRLFRSIDQSAVWKAFTLLLRLEQIAEVYCQRSHEPEAAKFYRATRGLHQAVATLCRTLDRLGMELAPIRLFENPPTGWVFEPQLGGPPLIWGSPQLKRVSLDLYRSRQGEDLYNVVVDVTTWGFRCRDFPDFGKGIVGYTAATWRQE